MKKGEEAGKVQDSLRVSSQRELHLAYVPVCWESETGLAANWEWQSISCGLLSLGPKDKAARKISCTFSGLDIYSSEYKQRSAHLDPWSLLSFWDKAGLAQWRPNIKGVDCGWRTPGLWQIPSHQDPQGFKALNRRFPVSLSTIAVASTLPHCQYLHNHGDYTVYTLLLTAFLDHTQLFM